MSVPAPHFRLIPTARTDRPPHESAAGQWRFVLEATDGSSKLEAADDEPEVSRDRLELLAIVRGLEALDQPSRVTVVTASRYVCRGIRFGLPAWREDAWQWERFGQLVPIKNADLWRRIDHAMGFHQVVCHYAGGAKPSPQLKVQKQTAVAPFSRNSAGLWQRLRDTSETCKSAVAQCLTPSHWRRMMPC
jgi:ribonuclease HI